MRTSCQYIVPAKSQEENADCDDLQHSNSLPLPIEEDELAHVGDVKYGIRIPKDALMRCEKSAKSAEKLALNLIEFLLSPEELQTVTVYGNLQHKKVPMDENKRRALRSHIFSIFRAEDGKWEKCVKAVNDKIRKQRPRKDNHQ